MLLNLNNKCCSTSIINRALNLEKFLPCIQLLHKIMCILRIGWVVVICLFQMCGTLKLVVGCSILRFWKPFSLKSWWQSSFYFLWAELTLEVRCYVGLDSRSTCKWDAEYSGFLFFYLFWSLFLFLFNKSWRTLQLVIAWKFFILFGIKILWYSGLLGTKSQASPTSSSFFILSFYSLFTSNEINLVLFYHALS